MATRIADSVSQKSHRALFFIRKMPKRKKVVAPTKSKSQPTLPQIYTASISSLPPEIALMIAKSLAPKDQLHLGLTCKSLLFLAAPNLLGAAIMRQPRRDPSWNSAIFIAYRAGLVNLELYDYFLEHDQVSSYNFNTASQIAGRHGAIAILKLWSNRYGMPISVDAALGAAENGQIAFLEWALDRPSASEWYVSSIFNTAARHGHEVVLDFLHARLDQTPWELSETVKSAAAAGHIDLALKLYRKIPLCCNSSVFFPAAEAITRRSFYSDGWQELLAEFVETPSFISDAVKSSVYNSAAIRNRVDIMRYLDQCFGPVDNDHQPHLALSHAIAYGNTDTFDYICRARPDWKTLVDDAICSMYLIRYPASYNNDTCIVLIRRVIRHIKKRSTLLTLIRKAVDMRNDEFFDFAVEKFRRRFGSPSSREVEKLYSAGCALESIKILCRRLPPRSTALANGIVRESFRPSEMIEVIRQFCPDIDLH
jgi:hypothetical protein